MATVIQPKQLMAEMCYYTCVSRRNVNVPIEVERLCSLLMQDTSHGLQTLTFRRLVSHKADSIDLAILFSCLLCDEFQNYQVVLHCPPGLLRRRLPLSFRRTYLYRQASVIRRGHVPGTDTNLYLGAGAVISQRVFTLAAAVRTPHRVRQSVRPTSCRSHCVHVREPDLLDLKPWRQRLILACWSGVLQERPSLTSLPASGSTD